MKFPVVMTVLLVAATMLVGAPASAGDAEPIDCVSFAKSWDAAVAEAKLLNVPIVVHSHGFYCGPCWGMHSALCCNKKYMDFAADNTVEVISLSDLEKGVEAGDRRAETYEAKVGGETAKYLCEFPGLTVEDVKALRHSKAGSYNQTGKIPYTCIVDPWTLEEIQHWSGGQSSKSIIEAVEVARATLEEAHGEGLSRKELRKLDRTEEKAAEAVEKQDYAKAIKLLDKAAKDAPEVLQPRIKEARDGVIEAAGKAIDEAESTEDAREAKRTLRRLRTKLKGTGLEPRVEQLLETIAAG